ncbi:MAG: hypothetical protein LLF76_14925 [Planctomycetaceae bacterium]|nr:hypothetical protein [Planctomycetaceae bacterium]
MTSICDCELSRQFGVIRQEIDMHATLRDNYHAKGLTLDLMLLVVSVLLTGASFVSKETFAAFGFADLFPLVQPIQSGCSVTLLALSIGVFKVDYKERSTMHKEAVNKLTQVLELYRRHHDSANDSWAEDAKEDLHEAYWNVHDCIVHIPTKKFNSLKARYKRKVEVSKLLDRYPHCPIWLMKGSLSVRYGIQFLCTFWGDKGKECNE